MQGNRVFSIVRAVRKFDFRLVTNEQWQGHAVITVPCFYRICMFPTHCLKRALSASNHAMQAHYILVSKEPDVDPLASGRREKAQKLRVRVKVKVKFTL